MGGVATVGCTVLPEGTHTELALHADQNRALYEGWHGEGRDNLRCPKRHIGWEQSGCLKTPALSTISKHCRWLLKSLSHKRQGEKTHTCSGQEKMKTTPHLLKSTDVMSTEQTLEQSRGARCAQTSSRDSRGPVTLPTAVPIHSTNHTNYFIASPPFQG